MNYLIESRAYKTIHPLTEEMQLQPDTNYFFNLDYLTVLQVEGEKGAEFLQGQLTCDMRLVSSSQMQQGLLCNLKGRIMAILDVMLLSNNNIGLVLPLDLIQDTQSMLSKAAAFSRVQLHQTAYQVYGLLIGNHDQLINSDLLLPSASYQALVNEQGMCYQVSENAYIYIAFNETVPAVMDRFEKRGSLSWHAMQLKQQKVEIYPESRGQFLPHRLDMHLSGYISFDKGCYKGQEIIARMHYRSTQKYHLVSFVSERAIPPQVGEAVLGNDGTTTIGEIIDYCLIGPNQYIVAASTISTLSVGMQ